MRFSTISNQTKDLELFRAYVHALSPITDQDWDKFVKKVQTGTLKRGENFTVIGEKTEHAGFITDGIFKQTFGDSEGNEFIWIFPKKGEPVASLSSLASNLPASNTITALVDARFLMVLYPDLLEIYESSMSWQRFGRRVAERYLFIREKRDEEFHFLEASKRYQLFCERHQGWMNDIPQADIAAYLGINPASLSRIRARLAKKKS